MPLLGISCHLSSFVNPLCFFSRYLYDQYIVSIQISYNTSWRTLKLVKLSVKQISWFINEKLCSGNFFHVYALFSMDISISLITYCIILCDKSQSERQVRWLESNYNLKPDMGHTALIFPQQPRWPEYNSPCLRGSRNRLKMLIAIASRV